VGAQSGGNTWEAIGGAALGGGAGTLVGAVGSLLPCTETYAGPHCVRWVALGAGAIGGAAGALVGHRDPTVLEDRAVGAAIGLTAGAAVGAALTPLIERWGPQDALAVGLIGGAVGTAPVGAAIGFGAGAASGALLWGLVPGFGSPRAASLALGGLAIGVLTEWVIRAASTDHAAPITVGVRVPF
jgi:hypothetical protein